MLNLVRDRYEVLAELGSGGEARVVKALDHQHDRFVALKIRMALDAAEREDLLGEARVLLALSPHPGLPLVREDFFDGDSYVVAMDWVEGTDLARLLAERGRPGLAPSSVLAYLAQAAEALTHLHAQSPPVIHGDVKPGNLILTTGGRIKLVDFGLSSAPNVPLRRAGTPGYRAPEVAAGAAPSRASDVYSLAATAFALLTGAVPAGVLPSWDGVPSVQAEQLEAAIRLGMATHPARRPKTPGELVERLRTGWAAGLPAGVVTFCQSAIEGSAALWDAHPQAMADVLVRHDELIAEAVTAHGGSFVKSTGDGTLSVFNSAPAAVAGAFAAERALAAEPWPPGLAVPVGWGLHTGEAERRDADYAGATVNLATRVREQAEPGQILLSAVTAELVVGHLPDGCALVDLGPHRLSGSATPERIRALAGPGARVPLGATECPYRGLPAFEPGDRRFFFGREQVVAEVLSRLAPGRLLALVGASGSGKSSVLRAGVVAAVRAGEVAGLRHVSLITPGPAPALDLDDAPDRLVVVDQFEEIFTLCDDPGLRRAFIAALAEVSGRVVIGVRADLYGRIAAHPELARAVADNQVLLGAMSDAELERAVKAPARVAGLRLDPGLVELALRDVAGEPGALPLLSHALRATWQRRDGRTLTLEGYRESGGVSAAIARTADGVVSSLPPEQQPLARSVFLRLTELGEGSEDTRRRASVGELVPEGVSPEVVEAVLERLADARLVTLGEGTAEVAHEALIREWPTLRGWLDEDREGVRLHRRLGDATRLWETGGREPTDLYRGTRLDAAAEWARANGADLNAPERAFIEAGLARADHERRAQRRTNRRLRGMLAASVILLVVAGLAGAVSLVQRNRARDQALTSDAQRIGAEALNAPTLDRSLLFAVAGVELQDRVETRSDLLAVLQRNPAAIRILQQSKVNLPALAVSPGGRLLATGDEAGVVRFTDLDTWQPVGSAVRLPHHMPVAHQAMTFSPDGRTLAVGTRQVDRSELDLVDVATHTARRVGAWRGYVDVLWPTTTLAYSPDGRHLAVALNTVDTGSQRLLLLDARTGRPLWERRFTSPWQVHVLFGRDGSLITSAQQAGTLVWDARTGRVVRRYSIGGRPALAPDGRSLALALNSPTLSVQNGRVGILDLRTGRHRVLQSEVQDYWILSIAVTRDGTQVVGTSHDATRVWNVASGKVVQTFDSEHAASPASVAVDRDRVLVTSDQGSVSVWDPSGGPAVGRRVWTSPPANMCPAGVCLVVDSRGRRAASLQGDGTVALIDLRSGRHLRTLAARDGETAPGLAFTPGGRRLVTGGTARTVTIRDVPSGTVVRRLRVPQTVGGVAVSPDGRRLAVLYGAIDGRVAHVEVHELQSGRTLYTRTVRFGVGQDVVFSRDSRVLVAAGCCNGGSGIEAWDAGSGAPLSSTPVAEGATWADIAPDSRTLAVGTADGRLVLSDVRTGRPLGRTMQAARGGIAQLAFSPDGRLLAASAANTTTTLWDVRSRRRVGDVFPIDPGMIQSIAFEPNGRLLFDAGEWPLDRATLQRFACRAAGRDLTREEWSALLPNRPYRPVCPSPK